MWHHNALVHKYCSTEELRETMPQQHVAYLIVSIAATVQGEQTFEPPSTRKELKGLCNKLTV